MRTLTKRAAPLAVLGLVVVGFVVVGFAVGFAGPAQAHNYLASSTPAEGETLTELPDEFIITTNDALLDLGGESGGFALQVTDAAGLYYGDGCVVIDGPSMTAEAALGAPGDYTLAWQVISADGHTISDDFAFTWQPTVDAPESEGSDTPPVCGESTAPEPEPTATAPIDTAQNPPTLGTDLLWIGGAAAAMIVAAIITLLVLRRKRA